MHLHIHAEGQLLDQVVGRDADRLGEAADIDGVLHLGVRLSRGGERGVAAALVRLTPTAAAAAFFVRLVQEGRGRHRGGNPALGGALSAPRSSAGAVGGCAESSGRGAFAFAILFLIDSRSNRWRSRAGGASQSRRGGRAGAWTEGAAAGPRRAG